MSRPEKLIRNVSDTARWVAIYRARESERPDAHFRDPFARRLAGERGEQIVGSMAFAGKHQWPYVARTWAVDHFVTEQVREGADMVINLAAGLDARPYRMALPASLQWVEVDLPEILEYKEEILGNEKPVCGLERIKMDLSNLDARRQLFTRLASRSRRALVVCEGLLVYLTADQVTALARDLGAQSSFQHWVIDLASPALLQMLKKQMRQLDEAGVPLKFAPADGLAFFERLGWKPGDVRSAIHTAAQLNRLPFFLRLIAKISSPHFHAKRPWSAVCLLAKSQG
jgi:methyltransferase (TIGR00027 family)